MECKLAIARREDSGVALLMECIRTTRKRKMTLSHHLLLSCFGGIQESGGWRKLVMERAYNCNGRNNGTQ